MGYLRAAIKLIAFIFCCLLAVPLQLLLLVFHKGRYAYLIPYIWHKGICLIGGIRYRIHGTPNKNGQTIYTFNHVSYLDIPLIGSILKASFVAKKEVKTWPVFGFLSQLQQTAFIDRARSAIARESDAIGAMAADGRNLIIFPEGTSTDGRKVRDFKSSLFALALKEGAEDIYLQPVTIKLVSADRQAPDNQDIRDLYAWHIDMDTPLPTHLWRFAKTRGARLDVIFHEPIKASEYNDRKTLAKLCQNNVSKGLEIENAA